MSNCLLWTAAKNRKGYGQYRDGKLYIAHRYAHNLLVEPVLPWNDVHHKCEVVACVLHTEQMSRAEHHKHTDPGRVHREKTHCPKGHPYSEENTLINKDGHRRCRTCNNARQRAAWATRRR
jgi:hypothetical protein